MTTAIALETSRRPAAGPGPGQCCLGVVAVLNLLLLAVRQWRKRTEGLRSGAVRSGRLILTSDVASAVHANPDAAAGTNLPPSARGLRCSA